MELLKGNNRLAKGRKSKIYGYRYSHIELEKKQLIDFCYKHLVECNICIDDSSSGAWLTLNGAIRPINSESKCSTIEMVDSLDQLFEIIE